MEPRAETIFHRNLTPTELESKQRTGEREGPSAFTTSLPSFLNTRTVFSILKLSSIDFGGDRKSHCVWSSSKLPLRFEKADHTGTLQRILNQNFIIFKLQQL